MKVGANAVLVVAPALLMIFLVLSSSAAVVGVTISFISEYLRGESQMSVCLWFVVCRQTGKDDEDEVKWVGGAESIQSELSNSQIFSTLQVFDWIK